VAVHDAQQGLRRFRISDPGKIADPVITCILELQAWCQHAIAGADRLANDALALPGRRTLRLVVDDFRRQIPVSGCRRRCRGDSQWCQGTKCDNDRDRAPCPIIQFAIVAFYHDPIGIYVFTAGVVLPGKRASSGSQARQDTPSVALRDMPWRRFDRVADSGCGERFCRLR
jgi:hypothetical protein